MLSDTPTINNGFYDELGLRWYNDVEHPVALLRIESTWKFQYVFDALKAANIGTDVKILDVGCGAGFIANPMAKAGYRVKGIDLSPTSLSTARRFAPSPSNPTYCVGDAYNLEEADASYDIVMMLDFLEHVDDPARAIREGARVLKPGGTLFFHTFNRTMIANLLVIKAIEILAKDCPEHMHVWHLFIKPTELTKMCEDAGMNVKDIRGLRPKIGCLGFWKSVLQRRVCDSFQFTRTRSLSVGYLGHAIKCN